MVLRYALTEADFRAAQRFAARWVQGRPGPRWRGFAANLALWVVVGVVVASALDSRGGWAAGWLTRDTVIGFLVAVALFAVMALVIARRMRMRQLQWLAPYPIEHTLQLHPEGIAVDNRFGHTQYTWAAFLDVQPLPAHVAIVVRPGAVLLIANEAFASPSERDAFVATVRRHLAAAAP